MGEGVLLMSRFVRVPLNAFRGGTATTSALGLILALLLNAGASAAGARASKVSLTDAVQHSSVVVVGRINRVERQGSVAVARLEVIYLARGSTNESKSFVFIAGSLEQRPPVGQLGQRVLAFLEPSGREVPPLRTAFGGAAVLPIFTERGEDFVGATGWGDLQLPVALCRPKTVPPSFFDCEARLSDVLKSIHLGRAEVPRAASPAVFRVLRRECATCNLETWVRPSVAVQKACGAASDSASRAVVESCVKTAVRDAKAFSVTLHLGGIDSEIVTAFFKESSGGRQFWYDSSVEGGPECAASVRVRDCGAIVLLDGRELLKCERPKAWRTLCSQADARVEVLDRGGPAENLDCSEESGRDFSDCVLGSRSGSDGGVHPSAQGPDLLCAHDGDKLECQAESEWPSKAPY